MLREEGQHRTGARNDDETSPLATASIWETARDGCTAAPGASPL